MAINDDPPQAVVTALRAHAFRSLANSFPVYYSRGKIVDLLHAVYVY
jgi:hypothetical protein